MVGFCLTLPQTNLAPEKEGFNMIFHSKWHLLKCCISFREGKTWEPPPEKKQKKKQFRTVDSSSESTRMDFFAKGFHSLPWDVHGIYICTELRYHKNHPSMQARITTPVDL